jgi:hypothetical protein
MVTGNSMTCSIRVPSYHAVDLSIDYPNSLQLRVRGQPDGTGS